MNNEITTSEKMVELATLLIPIEGKNLILPNVSVAEIIDYKNVQVNDKTPSWHLGILEWRTKKLPMISYEIVNGEHFHLGDQQAKIIIVNGVSKHDKLPFWGFVAAGSPRLMRLMDDEIFKKTDDKCGPAEVMSVSVNGELAHIPDLDYIEGMILSEN